MKNLFRSTWVAFVGSFIVSGVVLAEPGNEFVRESKTVIATLYVTEIHCQGKKDPTATLIWIPGAIEQECLSRGASQCEKIAQTKLFAAEGRPIASPPYQVLRQIPASVPPSVAKKLKLMIDKPGCAGAVKMPAVLKERSFRVRVKWLQWSNGEDFEILEFL
jgi:hypothetical protein